MLGTHILIDAKGAPGTLNSTAHIYEVLCSAASAAGMTIIGGEAHSFEPAGVTAYVLLKESHVSIHTWPEVEKCCIDIFTCGPAENAHKAYSEIVKRLNLSCFGVVVHDRWNTCHFDGKWEYNVNA